MREIKFRAWDGKRMDYGGCDCVLRSAPEAKVMQYTSLKDRNGKEIYEGDIIKVDDHAGLFTIHDLSFVYTFEYGDGLVGFTCEIIGNIYENPELIQHAKS
jgi:hypothetical protein